MRGEIRAGPRGERLVGPPIDDEVPVKVKCQGLSDSRWWDTVKENLDEEHDPVLAADLIEEGSNRREEARG